MGRAALMVACGLLVLAGCSDGNGSPQAGTSRPSAAPVTPPSTSVDPKVQPTAELLNDPAYWNAVLASLNHIAGNATRKVLSAGKLEPREVEAVRQVYGPKLLDQQQKALNAAANGNTQGLLVPPGDAVITVQRVVEVGASCAALDATLDNKAVNPSLPSGRFFVRLVPRELREPRLNPTPWAIDGYFATTGDGSAVCPA